MGRDLAPQPVARGPDLMPSGPQMTQPDGWDDRNSRGRFISSAVVLDTAIYNAAVHAGFGLLGAD